LSGLTNVPPVARTPSAPPASSSLAARPATRADLQGMEEARAVGAAMHGLDSAITSARRAHQLADQRSSLTMSFAPRGTQIDDSRGYVIYVAAEQVPNAMYRAWAEIMKDGKRVERSGLVGPRFAQAEAAEQYALEWARQWIDRECRTQAAAEAAPAVNAAATAARPLPAMRHVPEPVTANHGGPLHGPLNAFRGPLRRYPSEPAAPATEGNGSDRFPSYPALISHAG
jgi:hypothetical protein